MADYYDVDDPFVDDSDLMEADHVDRRKSKHSGFYVNKARARGRSRRRRSRRFRALPVVECSLGAVAPCHRGEDRSQLLGLMGAPLLRCAAGEDRARRRAGAAAAAVPAAAEAQAGAGAENLAFIGTTLDTPWHRSP